MESPNVENAGDTRRTSDLLRELVLDNPAPYVTLGEILKTLDDRAFGFIIFLLAFPNCLPVPPGFSTLMGILILPIAVQFLFGHVRPKLPRKVRERKINRNVLAHAVRVILPPLVWFEKLFRPRWFFFSQGWGERLVAVMILLLTFLLIVPMPPPLHFLPAAGIALIALGMMESDGAIIVAGVVTGIGAISSIGLLGKFILKFMGKIYHSLVS